MTSTKTRPTPRWGATDHPTEFALATSPNEVRQIATTEAVALPLGMENGAGLGGELDNVEHFYDRGIRYITLTHGAHNRLGDSSYDDAEPRWNGLSPFGEQVIAEMNRLGIMVDVSHVTDATALDAIEQSDAPVIASHSSCRHFTPGWERNVSDELIEGIADTGGVVMITFGSSFLRNAYRDRDAPIRDAMNAHIDSMGWAEDSREAVVYEQQTRREHPARLLGPSDSADPRGEPAPRLDGGGGHRGAAFRMRTLRGVPPPPQGRGGSEGASVRACRSSGTTTGRVFSSVATGAASLGALVRHR